jgi:hypothetical protein
MAIPLQAPSSAKTQEFTRCRNLQQVERLVEMHERGADRDGGGAHGGKPLAHRVHAADRGERGLGGAGATERVRPTDHHKVRSPNSPQPIDVAEYK